MNERIRELAEQAACDTRKDHNNPYWRMQDEIPEDATWWKKFAELLIQECVGIALEQKKWVEDQEIFNPQDEQWNCARAQQSQRIVDKIKKHFGVE